MINTPPPSLIIIFMEISRHKFNEKKYFYLKTASITSLVCDITKDNGIVTSLSNNIRNKILIFYVCDEE